MYGAACPGPQLPGPALLDDALTWTDCTSEAEHDARDPVLVVAHVPGLVPRSTA